MEHEGCNILGPREQPVPDVHCPELPKSNKPNAHSSACRERLSMEKIPKECRECKGIVEPKKEKRKVNHKTDHGKVCKRCSNIVETLMHTYCSECEPIATAEREARTKAKRKANKVVKYCARCNDKLENSKHKFCDPCKPLAKAERIQRKSDARKQKRIN